MMRVMMYAVVMHVVTHCDTCDDAHVGGWLQLFVISHQHPGELRCQAGCPKWTLWYLA